MRRCHSDCGQIVNPERTVIGWAIVYGPETKPAVLRAALDPSLYFTPLCAHYARALLALVDRGIALTCGAIEDELRRDGRWEQIGGAVGMGKLICDAGTLDDVRAAVPWLRVLARRRAEEERSARFLADAAAFSERWRREARERRERAA